MLIAGNRKHRMKQRADANVLCVQLSDKGIEQERHVVVDADENCLVAGSLLVAHAKREQLDDGFAGIALRGLFENEICQRNQRFGRIPRDVFGRRPPIKTGEKSP